MKSEADRQWDQFVARARADAVAKIHQSALTLCIAPPAGPDDVDIKQALELGASILLDKPIVIVAPAGRAVGSGLRRVATHVIDLEHDMDLEIGQRELNAKLVPVLDELGLRS